MGYGDWRFRYLGTLATFLCHNPQPSPNTFFSIFFPLIILKNLKKLVLFFHSFLVNFSYNRKVLEENSFWDSDCIFSVPGRHSGFLDLNHPLILPALFSIHFRKVISSSHGCSHNPYDIWCGFGICSDMMK